MSEHDLLVLAGGSGERLGGVDKARVRLAGRTMLDRVLAAAPDARRTVVVGPPHLARPGVPAVLEEPASGGPVAGIAAGLAALDPAGEVPVVVLACDVPRAARAVPSLLDALGSADVAHLVDADGRAQLLVAAYRRPALREALGRLRTGPHGVSVRRMAEHLVGVGVPDPLGLGEDVDTWEAARRVEAAVKEEERMSEHHQPVGPELTRWVSLLVEELGVDPDAVDVEAVLDLAREAAQAVARPAVPLTAFLAGYAVARSGGDHAAFSRTVERVTELARTWGEGA
ncbi:NTP transferase domain-containing protein [Isoptericola sp. b490]|uniref:NTP transferase domain-containing protein n=1 Tax=Actinotalea lenta TaxID=3064654 RepID=UPI0027125A25|nr:NTP transferase domain-containing protein [Isoptericola sp. b490]MDO8121578.1 NTP transferase domain-containing protein [Isoptericola sp. b490]